MHTSRQELYNVLKSQEQAEGRAEVAERDMGCAIDRALQTKHASSPSGNKDTTICLLPY